MIDRLALTWAHKGEALIDDGAGGYEWVDPRDPRSVEVRLLDEVARVGEVTGTPNDNLLINGDSLHTLDALLQTPEYGEAYRGKVKLVYIDPPFNTGQAFEHYDDGIEHSVWLGLMRERLEQVLELLAPDGSVWVHLDDAEVHYAKVLMDEVFGRANFIASVIWEKADSPRNSARFLSVDQDYILAYAKTVSLWTPNKLTRTDAVNAKYKNPDDDPRGLWFGDNLRANKPYSLGQYEVTGPTGRVFSPVKGKYWRISEARFRELDAAGIIYWGSKGDAFPTMKRYLSDVGDMVPRTLWRATETGSNRTSSNEMKALFPDIQSFSTPKPERLLERVLSIASDEGDIVVDVFGGSGTTAAVAHKMRRRWVTAEREQSTIDAYIRPRLTRVVEGNEPGGVTNAVGWAGGGGFRELAIAGPVCRRVDLGGVAALVIADGVGDVTLARFVAAQLGFTYEPDENGIVGSNGRARLAVVRGNADSAAVEALLAAIEENELLTLAATTATEDVRTTLRDARPGSRLVMIPNGLFPMGAVTR